MIFRDDSAPGDPEALYVPVEDEVEQDAVLHIFEEILADEDGDTDDGTEGDGIGGSADPDSREERS